MPAPLPKFAIDPSAMLSILGGQMLNGILFDIANYRNSGLTDGQIKERLKSDWETGQGAISVFQKQANEQFLAAQQQFYMNGTYGDVEDPSKALFTWHAVGQNTCKGCLDRMGQTKTFDEWQRIGLPGAGTTPCRYNCRCTLLPVETAKTLYRAKSPAEIERKARLPIEERRKAVLESEEERGQPYADSTFDQKLGQFRSPESKNVDPRTRP